MRPVIFEITFAVKPKPFTNKRSKLPLVACELA